MSRLHKVVEKELTRVNGLDMSKVNSGINLLLEYSFDAIDDAESDEDKVALLYSVKTICITYGVKTPNWWYNARNRTDWQDDEAGLRYGYDLGGF